jgi:hypothetical protein
VRVCAGSFVRLEVDQSTSEIVGLVKIVGVSGRMAETPARVLMTEFDPDQLESLMVAAFALLGKPEAEAWELARAILKAAERPQSGDPGPRDRDLTRHH